MFVFLRKAFLSIARERGTGDKFRVCARLRGDIEAVFPGVPVTEPLGSEYRFHATVPGTDLALALMREADAIEYENFHEAIEGGDRQRFYTNAWYAMKSAQDFEQNQEARALLGSSLRSVILDEVGPLIENPEEELEVRSHATRTA